jgi:hypothetical protein
MLKTWGPKQTQRPIQCSLEIHTARGHEPDRGPECGFGPMKRQIQLKRTSRAGIAFGLCKKLQNQILRPDSRHDVSHFANPIATRRIHLD